MDKVGDLDAAIERYHEADRRIIRGDASLYKQVYSHSADATLANPFGRIWHGWGEVGPGLDRAAALYSDGEFIVNESKARHVSGELAYMVEIQRFRARLAGDSEQSERALRTTSILRLEDDGSWHVVHRHADPRTEPGVPDPSTLG
jgi:ketosteroid isomerase-like protein